MIWDIGCGGSRNLRKPNIYRAERAATEAGRGSKYSPKVAGWRAVVSGLDTALHGQYYALTIHELMQMTFGDLSARLMDHS